MTHDIYLVPQVEVIYDNPLSRKGSSSCTVHIKGSPEKRAIGSCYEMAMISLAQAYPSYFGVIKNVKTGKGEAHE